MGRRQSPSWAPELAHSAAANQDSRRRRDRSSASSASHNCGRIFGNRIQHWLNIRRRAGDDAQDLTRRRLLLQRLFELVEQPHVLDGDHGLVGEGFQQLDLRRGEGAYLDATRVQRSNEFSLLTKGNEQEGAPAAE